MQTIRIGAGAGYSGDRIEPALELAQHGRLDYLVFECLAERTIALAQGERRRDPAAGFDPLLRERMRAVLPACRLAGCGSSPTWVPPTRSPPPAGPPPSRANSACPACASPQSPATT